MGRGDHKRDINIEKSFEALGDAKLQALVGFHVFTGCNQTGKFNDHAKQSWWNTFITSPKKVIDALLLVNSVKHQTEEWHNHVCPESLLQKPSNRYRQPFKVPVAYVFKNQLEPEKLAPTFSTLKYTIHWSYYMTYIWTSAVSTNPIYDSQTSCSSVGDRT